MCRVGCVAAIDSRDVRRDAPAQALKAETQVSLSRVVVVGGWTHGIGFRGARIWAYALRSIGWTWTRARANHFWWPRPRCRAEDCAASTRQPRVCLALLRTPCDGALLWSRIVVGRMWCSCAQWILQNVCACAMRIAHCRLRRVTNWEYIRFDVRPKTVECCAVHRKYWTVDLRKVISDRQLNGLPEKCRGEWPASGTRRSRGHNCRLKRNFAELSFSPATRFPLHKLWNLFRKFGRFEHWIVINNNKWAQQNSV